MKTAIIMAGNFGCHRLAIDSIKKNIIDPNNADVFILASKSNYLHLIDEETLYGPVEGTDFYIPVTEEDEERTRDCFGESVKVLEYVEDMADYPQRLATAVDEVNARAAWIANSNGHVAGYNKELKKFQHSVKYIDPWLRLEYLTRVLSSYELDKKITYDCIMRIRIDQNFDRKIVAQVADDKEELHWIGMDNFFYGTQKTIKHICLNFVKRIGEFRSEDKLITPEADFRVTTEPQFIAFVQKIVKDRGIELQRINMKGIGIKLHKRNSFVSVPNFPKSEKDRKRKSQTRKEYYDFIEFDLSQYYAEFKCKYNTIFSYYIH